MLIGEGLGFTTAELFRIKDNAIICTDAPSSYSYMSDMLSSWVRWAPGDARGSRDYATMDSLRTALEIAGITEEL